MKPSILQTTAWQNFQHDLGETTFFEQNQDYQYLIIKKSTPAGPYFYLPYGPYIAHKNAAQTAYEAVKALAEREGVIFIRIEPESPENASYWLEQPNCIKSHDLNPADTWVLDLTQEKPEIITNFSQGTRTRYNTFAKKGLSVTTSKNPDDIKHLVDLQQKLAKTKKIATFSENYLKTELAQDFATLYLVHYTDPEDSQDKIIAASLFFDDKTTRYYMQSAADFSYKKLPGTVALLTTAIFDAKEKGLKNFDFWGIAPDNAPSDHPWAGFTEFKKSFGGKAVHYAGTHDIILNKSKYRLYQRLRKLNRLKRHFVREK